MWPQVKPASTVLCFRKLTQRDNKQELMPFLVRNWRTDPLHLRCWVSGSRWSWEGSTVRMVHSAEEQAVVLLWILHWHSVSRSEDRWTFWDWPCDNYTVWSSLTSTEWCHDTSKPHCSLHCPNPMMQCSTKCLEHVVWTRSIAWWCNTSHSAHWTDWRTLRCNSWHTQGTQVFELNLLSHFTARVS